MSDGKKILRLIVFRHWFEELKSGHKTVEYREATRFWRKRLIGVHYDAVEFRYRYDKSGDVLLFEFGDVRFLYDERLIAIDLGKRIA